MQAMSNTETNDSGLRNVNYLCTSIKPRGKRGRIDCGAGDGDGVVNVREETNNNQMPK